MTNASRDQNNVPTLLGTLDSDGSTIVAVCVDSVNNALCVINASTGSDMGPSYALRDSNFVPALMAVSSADGVTPVAVYADTNGALLIDTN